MEETISSLLRNKGYKVTPARLAILEIISKKKIPLTAEIIFGKLGKTKDCKNINATTVYRTLASLEESGILRRVDLRKDSVYFELAHEHHHHIICTNCNELEDFKNKEIEQLIGRIALKSSKFSSKFKLIKEHSLELFGLCRECYK